MTSSLPKPISALIVAFGKLPGIGPRSAERLALYLVQAELNEVRQLAQLLVSAREQVRNCPIGGALTEVTPCSLCTDHVRENALLCVVERPVDVLIVEKAGTYHGTYHVLGGNISHGSAIGPEKLPFQ